MSEIVVDAPCGRLKGLRAPEGEAFLGVRYGEPPIGALRWKPPVAARPQSGLIDATRYGPSPPQTPLPATPWRPASPPGETSEDCLNLNVWTPAADDARRPTLVHVFGGGFETGGASGGVQDGAKLAAEGDVVVVRVNFRIGALGFLHLADAFGPDYDPANRGALDLILALRWVRDNIAALGGDPDNVTLFGLSSGAFTIAALFAMPGARDLFHKAWMQSGSASRILTRAQGAAVAEAFLRIAGVSDARALETLDLGSILRAQREAAALDLGDRNAPGGRTLGIVDDGASLPEHPLSAFARGERRGVPIVLGLTRDEARLWFVAGLMRLPATFDEIREEMRKFTGTSGDDLLAFYRRRFPDPGPVGLRERFLTDAVYTVPALRTAQAHSAGGGLAFIYRFDWAPTGAFERLGASHGLDEAFVWNAARPPAFALASGDETAHATARDMSNALLRFAREDAPPWPALATTKVVKLFGGSKEAAPLDEALLAAWRS